MDGRTSCLYAYSLKYHAGRKFQISFQKAKEVFAFCHCGKSIGQLVLQILTKTAIFTFIKGLSLILYTKLLMLQWVVIFKMLHLATEITSYIASQLYMLKSICHVVAHSTRVLRLSCRSTWSFTGFMIGLQIKMSSAKSQSSLCSQIAIQLYINYTR